MSEATASCGRGSLTFEAMQLNDVTHKNTHFLDLAESSTAVQPQLTTLAVKKCTQKNDYYLFMFFFWSCVYFIYACYIVWQPVYVYLYNFVVITADKVAKEK